MRASFAALVCASLVSLGINATAQDLSFSLFADQPTPAIAESAPLEFSIFEPDAFAEVRGDLVFCLFNKPAEPVEAPKPPRAKQLLVFKAEWCGDPCKTVERETLPPLAKRGWKIGDDETAQIRTIDFERRKDLASQYRVDAVPTWVMLEHGQEVDRHVGVLDPFGVGRLYSGEGRHAVAFR